MGSTLDDSFMVGDSMAFLLSKGMRIQRPVFYGFISFLSLFSCEKSGNGRDLWKGFFMPWRNGH